MGSCCWGDITLLQSYLVLHYIPESIDFKISFTFSGFHCQMFNICSYFHHPHAPSQSTSSSSSKSGQLGHIGYPLFPLSWFQPFQHHSRLLFIFHLALLAWCSFSGRSSDKCHCLCAWRLQRKNKATWKQLPQAAKVRPGCILKIKKRFR